MIIKSTLDKRKNIQNVMNKLFSTFTWLAAFVIITLPCLAQQPLQDGKGDGTLFIDSGGFTQINIADPSIRLGYLYDTKNDWSFGIDLSGKLTGSRASFLNNNRVASDAKIAFTIGKKYIGMKAFDPKKITVTTVFLAGVQRVLIKEGIILAGVELPSPTELQRLLPRVKPKKEIDKSPNFQAYLG